MIERWSWTSSNGEATDSQTQAAYKVIINKEDIMLFNSAVWNDLVDKVMEVRQELDLNWDTTYADKDETKIIYYPKILKANKFNSLRLNTTYTNWSWATIPTAEGYIGRTDFRGVNQTGYQSADTVYGVYFLELVNRLNLIIDIINGDITAGDMTGTIPTGRFGNQVLLKVIDTSNSMEGIINLHFGKEVTLDTMRVAIAEGIISGYFSYGAKLNVSSSIHIIPVKKDTHFSFSFAVDPALIVQHSEILNFKENMYYTNSGIINTPTRFLLSSPEQIFLYNGYGKLIEKMPKPLRILLNSIFSGDQSVLTIEQNAIRMNILCNFIFNHNARINLRRARYFNTTENFIASLTSVLTQPIALDVSSGVQCFIAVSL